MITNDYRAADRMIDLIEDNYRLLQVMSRFGMSLGFGDRTVDHVCRSNKVDTRTFLAVVNFIHSGYTQLESKPEELSVRTLMDYLRQSHRYFLDFRFPRIHRRLHDVVASDDHNSIPGIIHRRLDDYLQEATRHIRHEEKTLFPYVEGLLRGKADANYTVAMFSRRHKSLDESLGELKRILIQYNPNNENANELNDVLYEIYCCQDELDSHCKAEDYIFAPAVLHLEEKVYNEKKQ